MKFLKNHLLYISILISSVASAQTKSDIFGNSKNLITWLGIDFSKVVYIGDPGTVSPEEMKGLFSKINILIISEPDKYDIKKYFRKSNVESNITYTEENNKNVNTEKLISFNSKDYQKFDESIVKTVVDTYKFESSEKGIGLVFIVDGMNKIIEEASMWVTFINIETKEVIFTERLTGKAAGFGFRNHWAGAVEDVMKKVKSTYWQEWFKTYPSSK
jgi:hypothetical protein